VRYVAFLRGIGPGNPNMANARVRAVFEGIGLTDVSTLLTSGNVVFEAPAARRSRLEAEIQAALRSELDISGLAVVRDAKELQRFVDTGPFGSLEHSPGRYLLVTLLKRRGSGSTLPEVPDGSEFRVVGFDADLDAWCTVTEASGQTPRTMTWLERHLGKEVTGRTFPTVERAAGRLRGR
jgi:uncharacterized protein (DUF1697 family)